MLSVYRTLSTRYLSKRWFRAILIVACIALGVGTLVATRALSETMNRAGLQASNPLAGTADLLVSGGGSDKLIDRDLTRELAKIPGIRTAQPRLFSKIKLPQLDNRSALLIGIELKAELSSGEHKFWTVTFDKQYTDLNFESIAKDFFGVLFLEQVYVVLGKDLEQQLAEGTKNVKVHLPGIKKNPDGSDKINELIRVGTVDAHGPAVALGGNILIVEIGAANKLLQLHNKASRIDLSLQPDADRDKVRAQVTEVLKGRAEVHTPEEQNQMVQSVFAGMQTGFSLCGLAALVVGLFLVYNALAVSVAERRHEIGIILSLGATRAQIQMLFAGEATLLGLVGSLLGIPLGIGLAYFGLQPVQQVLKDVFMELEARQVDISPGMIVLALVAGTLTAVMAALVPAIAASGENPAAAVRRVPQLATWHYRAVQTGFAVLCIVVGVILVAVRGWLPYQVGTFGGMVLVLLGALVATPLFAALAAALLQPFLRHLLGIEGRLAADNLVRSPARTGLVIAALAAGVSLVMQIAGTIKSNREALRDWTRDTMSADLFVTSGSPIGAGGQSELMPFALTAELESNRKELAVLGPSLAGLVAAPFGQGSILASAQLHSGKARFPDIERALPVRSGKHTVDGKQILILALPAADIYKMEEAQAQANPAKKKPNPLFKQMGEQKNAMIVSENFRAKQGTQPGDMITLTSKHGHTDFRVIGQMVDYSWNHGTLIVNYDDYVKHWDDDKVEVFDVYLKPGADPEQTRKEILRAYGAEYGLVIQTREELRARIDGMIERLYGIAYGQLVVVMIVAALGVVTSLMISVLQRRREMGLLRAIGASKVQILRSVLAEAALMGVIGTVIGLLVGIPMEWYVLQVVLLEESGYLFAVYIPWLEALIIAGAAIFLATIAGLGPALYAVRERIPEAIAYE